jgi:hypothetical protein
VLARIALYTVLAPTEILSPDDLKNLHSLLLTSRRFYSVLSMGNNPDLYSSIFRAMFDVNPIETRLGSNAIVQSALIFELPRHVGLLRRIKRALGDSQDGPIDTQTVLNDLCTVSLMLLDDGAKTRQQLHHAGLRQFLEVVFTRFLETGLSKMLTPDPLFSLVFALMWMTGPRGV